jgi:hypothetical protein
LDRCDDADEYENEDVCKVNIDDKEQSAVEMISFLT